MEVSPARSNNLKQQKLSIILNIRVNFFLWHKQSQLSKWILVAATCIPKGTCKKVKLLSATP